MESIQASGRQKNRFITAGSLVMLPESHTHPGPPGRRRIGTWPTSGLQPLPNVCRLRKSLPHLRISGNHPPAQRRKPHLRKRTTSLLFRRSLRPCAPPSPGPLLPDGALSPKPFTKTSANAGAASSAASDRFPPTRNAPITTGNAPDFHMREYASWEKRMDISGSPA